MIGLRSTRVIIVDDDQNEALPIMKAFAKKGIPCAYFHGANLKELPEEKDKFLGIRLAVLDMDLVPGVGDKKSKISTLISCLERLLSPDNGPYIALIWTNNPGLKDLFEQNIFSSTNLPNPIDIIMLTKAECKNKGELDIGIIEEKIEKSFKSFGPLKIIQAWEGKNFEAATEVSNILTTLTTDERDPKRWREAWRKQTLNLMFSLAKEAVGEGIDKSSVLSGLYNSLDPLHADRMESYIGDLSDSLSRNAEEVLEHNEGCGIEQISKINTMLHLAFKEDSKHCGGNIYRFKGKSPVWVPSRDALLMDLLKDNSEVNRKNIAQKCQNIVIEISASCDHAQKNIRALRFLAGLLVPRSERSKIKKAEFIWDFGPVLIENNKRQRPYFFYFSARHLVTCSPDKTSKMNPFARLRSQALISLQTWFARHASRPGLVLLKDK